MAQVRSFLEVSRVGSVTRAAENLALTQPAVTQHIQGLEREFAAVLFERGSRGMRPTGSGLALRRHLLEAVGCLERARVAVRQLESGATGRLTVGTAITPGSGGMTECIRRLRRDHPGVDITLRIARSEVVVSLVLDGQLDLGIAAVGAGRGPLRVTPLYEQRFVMVAAADHPAAGKRVRKSDAASLPMIGCSAGAWVGVEGGLAAGRTPTARLEADTLEGMKELVLAGLGCAILPSHDVAAELSAGRLVEVHVAGFRLPKRVISLLQRRDAVTRPAARAFIGIAQGHYRDAP